MPEEASVVSKVYVVYRQTDSLGSLFYYIAENWTAFVELLREIMSDLWRFSIFFILHTHRYADGKHLSFLERYERKGNLSKTGPHPHATYFTYM
jgi:hypothetical protein